MAVVVLRVAYNSFWSSMGPGNIGGGDGGGPNEFQDLNAGSDEAGAFIEYSLFGQSNSSRKRGDTVAML